MVTTDTFFLKLSQVYPQARASFLRRAERRKQKLKHAEKEKQREREPEHRKDIYT
jgi:hypothetical protein